MNIAVVGWGYPPKIDGGLDIHVYETVTRLAKLGHKIHLFIPSFNQPEDNHVDNLIIHPIPIEKKITDLDVLIKAIKQYNRRIISTLKIMDFDLIHTHDWIGVGSGLWARKNLNKPWIATFHSLEYMRSTVDNSKSYMSDLEKRSLKHCDAVMTVSNLMKDEIEKRYRIEGRKISVIYNSGSIDENKEIKSIVKKKDRTVLYIGRLAAQKGVEYLLTAAKDVIRQYPDSMFVIVGSGYMQSNLERHAKVLGIENNVSFEGFVKSEKLADYYRDSDIFVSPSIYEPFGITVVDSMKLGVPVIVTDNTGAVEGMTDGKDYIKIEYRNSKSISDSIIRLFSDDNLRRSIGLNGKKAASVYSWDRCAGEISDLYRLVSNNQ